MKVVKNITLLVLFALGSISISSFVEQEQSNKLLFFVNSSVVDRATLTKSKIEDIYFGDKTVWSNNNKIIPCYLESGSPAGKIFFNDYIKLTESNFNRHWIKLIFSGNSQAPKKFTSSEQIIKYVGGKKGSIGFILVKDKELLKSQTNILIVQ